MIEEELIGIEHPVWDSKDMTFEELWPLVGKSLASAICDSQLRYNRVSYPELHVISIDRDAGTITLGIEMSKNGRFSLGGESKNKVGQ